MERKISKSWEYICLWLSSGAAFQPPVAGASADTFQSLLEAAGAQVMANSDRTKKSVCDT